MKAAAGEAAISRQKFPLPGTVSRAMLGDAAGAPAERPGQGHEVARLDGKDLAADIERLSSEVEGDIAIFGSSELATSLLRAGLIDEIRILIHPVLLGRGRSLLHGVARPSDVKLGPSLKALRSALLDHFF